MRTAATPVFARRCHAHQPRLSCKAFPAPMMDTLGRIADAVKVRHNRLARQSRAAISVTTRHQCTVCPLSPLSSPLLVRFLQTEMVIEGAMHVPLTTAGGCMERYASLMGLADSAPEVRANPRALLYSSRPTSESDTTIREEAACLATPWEPGEEGERSFSSFVRAAKRTACRRCAQLRGAGRMNTTICMHACRQVHALKQLQATLQRQLLHAYSPSS